MISCFSEAGDNDLEHNGNGNYKKNNPLFEVKQRTVIKALNAV